MSNHREEIRRIRQELENSKNRKWFCEEEVKIKMPDGSTKWIDLCCKDNFNTLFCLEAEDRSSKKQILINEMKLDTIGEKAKQDGQNFKKCHALVEDLHDWRGVCK